MLFKNIIFLNSGLIQQALFEGVHQTYSYGSHVVQREWHSVPARRAGGDVTVDPVGMCRTVCLIVGRRNYRVTRFAQQRTPLFVWN